MEKREKIIRVLLTEEEWRDIVKAAREAAMPLAVYVRVAAVASARTKKTD